MRECPIVTRDTSLTGAEGDHRFLVAVRASQPSDADALRGGARRDQRGASVGAHVDTPAPTILKPIFCFTTTTEPSVGR